MWMKAPLLKERDKVAVLKSEIDIANRLGNNNRRNLTYTVMA
jgi:hypothetical protein